MSCRVVTFVRHCEVWTNAKEVCGFPSSTSSCSVLTTTTTTPFNTRLINYLFQACRRHDSLFSSSEFFSLRRRRRRGVVLRVVLVVAGAAQLIHGIINQERKSREQEREKEREKKSIRTISCWPKWENNKRFLSRYTRIDMRAVHVTYIRTVHTCRYIQVRQGKAGKRSLRALCGCCLLSLSLLK